MMDGRNWPWKKKSSEKLSSATDLRDSFYSFKQGDEQESEKNIKILKDQLSVALSNLATKEDLVKQHAKVAEEAVTGWEKAEAEALSLRQTLDAALQQKLAAEDRVLHLDGALKECMRQLRHVREEQEQRMHDTVMKKAREWEKIHTDLNVKLADCGSQLFQARAENNAMSKSLQERTRTIVEVSEAKALADAEVKALQVRLGVMDKENIKLKYENHMLSKELEIWSQERECNKKAQEAANKQHLENVKKNAKLETECQRLRLLVRKRLPGPAAFAQMRLEAEALGKENGEGNRKKSPYRRNASFSAVSVDCMSDNLARESEKLSDHVVAMEEETKILKEVLAKRNYELQAARLMCARTASKLSILEEQLDRLSVTYGFPKPFCTVSEGYAGPLHPAITSKDSSPAPLSENGAMEDDVSCAESWASALMAELAHFRKEKIDKTVGRVLDSSTLDLMDDFNEMEKLASLPFESHTELLGVAKKSIEVPGNNGQGLITENRKRLQLCFAEKAEELESATCLCKELRKKLAHAEQQVIALHERERKYGAVIACLKQHFFAIFKAQVDGSNLNKVLEDVKGLLETMEESEQLIIACAEESCKSFIENVISDAKITAPSSPSSQSQESNVKEITHVSSVIDSKCWAVAPELADAMQKVLDLVESFVQSDYSVSFPQLLPGNANGSASASENSIDQNDADCRMEWKKLEFDASIQSLIILCQCVLQGKVDIIDFIAELASVLDWLVRYILSPSNKSAVKPCIRRRLERSKESPAIREPDVASTANCLVFQPHKVSDSDRKCAERSLLPITDEDGVSNVCSGTGTQEEIQSILLEKEALQTILESERRKITSLDCEISQLKSEKDKMEQNYKLAKEQLEALRNLHKSSQHHLVDAKAQLTTALEKRQALENNSTDILHAKEFAEAELQTVKDDLKQLQNRAPVLRLLEKTNSPTDVETMLTAQQQHDQQPIRNQLIERVSEFASSGPCANEDVMLQKEQEIVSATKKLAECQQIILVLGKQLKALGASTDMVEASLNSPSDVTSTNQFCSPDAQMNYAHESSHAFYHTGIDTPKASPSYGWSRDKRDRRLDHENTQGPRNDHHSVSVETDPVQGGQNNAMHGGIPTSGGQVSADSYKDDAFLSSFEGNHHEGTDSIKSAPVGKNRSSPGRSPARFLTLMNRKSSEHDSSKHVNDRQSVSSSEKHGTSFSRFFLRTKTGN